MPLVSRAQVQCVSRAITWIKPSVSNINDSVVMRISFNGAFYSGSQSLPVWNETFFADNFSENVTIDSCIFLPFADDELQLIQASGIQLPSELSY